MPHLHLSCPIRPARRRLLQARLFQHNLLQALQKGNEIKRMLHHSPASHLSVASLILQDSLVHFKLRRPHSCHCLPAAVLVQ